MGKIGIVIINFNGYELTCDCVDSLMRSTYTDFEIYLVDNGSIDGSGQRLVERYGDERVILSSANLGFSGGNNLGIRAALQQGCDYILLLNNDTEIAADALEKMVELSDGRYVVVPSIFYYDNPTTLWYGGGHFNAFDVPKHIVDPAAAERSVDFACGCCILMPSSVVETVGMWEESYFLYWEDADYSKRITEHGFEILYQPEAKLWHKVSSSTGGKLSPLSQYYNYRNKLLFVSQHSHSLKTKAYCFVSIVVKLAKPSTRTYAKYALADASKGISGQCRREL